MKRYELVLFDLDGTLTDPQEGIVKGILYSLDKLGLIETNRERLPSFIGPPLTETFSMHYGLNPEQTMEAVFHYREYYKKRGMFENIVFPYIPQLLETLKNKERKLAVATSKPTVFAEGILQYFGLERYFDCIMGSNLDGTRSAKSEIVADVLLSFPEIAREAAVMVGDRKYDCIGALDNRIDSIAVTYGYGTLEELTLAKPTMIASSVQQIGEIILGKYACDIG